MKLTFDTCGNEKQKDCARAWLDNSIEDIIYGGAKGTAKSFTGCALIFGDAFIYPETHYFIARKELNNIRKFTIPSIHEVFNLWGITHEYYTFNGQDNYYTLTNKSKVFLLDAKYLPSDPQYMRFGSMQNTRGWIEEAGEFEEDARNNLMASVGRWNNNKYGINGKILQTCNPSKNYLYKDYKDNKTGTLPPQKRFIQALPNDNKRLQAGYLDMLSRTLNKNQKERLLLGNWEYDDDPTAMCEYDNILGIFTNDHIKENGKKTVTIDVARFGSDKAIVCVWDGMVLFETYIFEISKTTIIQSCIDSMRIKHGIPKNRCIGDEDGVGGGVIDNTGILGFVNNSRALNDENYFNLQSQCGYKLAEYINAGKIYIKADLSDKHKEEIIEDLEQLKTFKQDNDSKLRILPKEQIKQNIGRSPDWRDVLLMRMYFELNPNQGKYSFI